MDMQSCIEACQSSQVACTICAEECHRQGLSELAALCDACAEQCRRAVEAMAHDSMKECGLCAHLCGQCSEECAKIDGEAFTHCAEVCSRSAEECGKMAAMAGGQAMLF